MTHVGQELALGRGRHLRLLESGERLLTHNYVLVESLALLQARLGLAAAVKLAAVRSCQTGFSPTHYLRAISTADIDFKPDKERKNQPAENTTSDVNPELFEALQDWRAAKADETAVAPYQILHQSILIQITILLPADLTVLRTIKGIGKRSAKKYGKELLDLVAAYRRKHRKPN